jgi:hypothetical protein
MDAGHYSFHLHTLSKRERARERKKERQKEIERQREREKRMYDALSHLNFFFILHALSVFLAMHTHSPKKWMHESKKKNSSRNAT